MHALLSGLVLACVSGLTALAFRHPRAFARLYPYLVLGVSAVFVGLTVWHLAVQFTWITVHEFIMPENLESASVEKHGIELPYPWIAAGYAAALVFLWINRKLPSYVSEIEGTRKSKIKPKASDRPPVDKDGNRRV